MGRRTRFYALQGREVVPCDGFFEWRQAFARSILSGARIVREDLIGEGVVSTVFVGIDHGRGFGQLRCFETAVLGCEGYSIFGYAGTWVEAEAVHAAACGCVRATLLRAEIALERAAVLSR